MKNNADQLRELKEQYGLTSQGVADKLEVSRHTVDSWLINADSSNHRPMPDRELRFLRLIVKDDAPKVTYLGCKPD